ncbi:MAG: phosphotransferase [Gammaproteobacteria bacterium]|nr:phosphotransferase [Gammaproteobacteria bacterium]
MDQRLSTIKSWLSDVLNSEDFTITPASSDASFRRYFRVSQAELTWIVMDAPPSQEDIAPFIKVSQFLNSQSLHVPNIIAQNSEMGLLLLSDLGTQPYLDMLNNHSADNLYRDAIDSLIKIQCSDPTGIDLPRYDSKLLQTELNLFPEWFLERHFELSPPAFLQPLFDTLIDNALSQPQSVVHRDYHSRNLMVDAKHNPGIIDFQDAVIGPITYDLVSLLRDCYISWPEDKLEAWIHYYFSAAQQHELLPNCDITTFTRWFDLMGLQRHLKVLGIFCRLNYRDNKPNYIDDLPQTLRYILQVCRRYDNLQPLADFLSSNNQINALSK